MRPHVQFIRYNIAEMHRVHLAVIQFTPQRFSQARSPDMP